ncbi:hypothetical protein BHE74_00022211 [Ensete ventricosum]|nr:hypothetical protein GW17_00021428 [Ensete ventricosum]RWW70149.1 hypothetical protein BHE74_00022211 [Ensete ventricosum]RZR91726.1 hypothetical protein BHM03_00019902 [Ensete ventricosum]
MNDRVGVVFGNEDFCRSSVDNPSKAIRDRNSFESHLGLETDWGLEAWEPVVPILWLRVFWVLFWTRCFDSLPCRRGPPDTLKVAGGVLHRDLGYGARARCGLIPAQPPVKPDVPFDSAAPGRRISLFTITKPCVLPVATLCAAAGGFERRDPLPLLC